jgi:hypothetical protein
MKEYIGRWVILKRVRNKIRSGRSPLIMGRREWAEIEGIEWELGRFLGFGVLGWTSEKGSSRKHTENWVTSCIKMYWGNLWVLRCFAKGIILGELVFGIFWDFGRRSTWVVWGGGTISMFLGELNVWMGDLRCKERGVYYQEQPRRTRGLLSRTTAKDEGFTIKNNREGRGVYYQEQPRGTRGLLSRTTAKDEGFTIKNNREGRGVYWNTRWGHKLSAGGEPEVATRGGPEWPEHSKPSKGPNNCSQGILSSFTNWEP